MISQQPKLCIVAPWIYPLFNPCNQSHFGGWEVRMAFIARGLAELGNFQVSVLTGDHGQPHVEQHGKIKLYSWHGREIWGIPHQHQTSNPVENLWRQIKSLFHAPLLTGQIGRYLIKPEMVKAYDEIDADIYTVPGNSQFSGELAYYCKQRNKKYVFLAGSDFDFYPEYKTEPEKVDMYGVPYALKTYALENAVTHVLQNDKQALMLKEGFGFDGTVIRNPIDLNLSYPRRSSPRSILWVGKSDERVKRPSLIFKLARHLPHFSFTIIMNKSNLETHEVYLKEAQSLPNITLIERVPFEEIERYYAAARLFVNTSAFEGFPNTFLQAAKYGVPIIATDIDPGGIFSEHNCGITCGGNFESFVESVQRLMTDDALYTKMSSAILHYVQKYHDKDVIVAQFEKLFHEALSS